MTLSRTIVVPGMAAEYQRFAELLRSLSDDDWHRPTRCEGWSVADVAAHVVGTLTEVANFRLEGLGTPETTQRIVDERRGRTADELADELEASAKLGTDILSGFDDEGWNSPAPGGVAGSVGFGVETLWYDTFVHADDIRTAIGRPSESGDGVKAAISHITTVLDEQGFSSDRLAAVGADVDEFAFVLAATGRRDPSSLGFDETVNIYR